MITWAGEQVAQRWAPVSGVRQDRRGEPWEALEAGVPDGRGMERKELDRDVE